MGKSFGKVIFNKDFPIIDKLNQPDKNGNLVGQVNVDKNGVPSTDPPTPDNVDNLANKPDNPNLNPLLQQMITLLNTPIKGPTITLSPST